MNTDYNRDFRNPQGTAGRYHFTPMSLDDVEDGGGSVPGLQRCIFNTVGKGIGGYVLDGMQKSGSVITEGNALFPGAGIIHFAETTISDIEASPGSGGIVYATSLGTYNYSTSKKKTTIEIPVLYHDGTTWIFIAPTFHQPEALEYPIKRFSFKDVEICESTLRFRSDDDDFTSSGRVRLSNDSVEIGDFTFDPATDEMTVGSLSIKDGVVDLGDGGALKFGSDDHRILDDDDDVKIISIDDVIIIPGGAGHGGGLYIKDEGANGIKIEPIDTGANSNLLSKFTSLSLGNGEEIEISKSSLEEHPNGQDEDTGTLKTTTGYFRVVDSDDNGIWFDISVEDDNSMARIIPRATYSSLGIAAKPFKTLYIDDIQFGGKNSIEFTDTFFVEGTEGGITLDPGENLFTVDGNSKIIGDLTLTGNLEATLLDVEIDHLTVTDVLDVTGEGDSMNLHDGNIVGVDTLGVDRITVYDSITFSNWPGWFSTIDLSSFGIDSQAGTGDAVLSIVDASALNQREVKDTLKVFANVLGDVEIKMTGRLTVPAQAGEFKVRVYSWRTSTLANKTFKISAKIYSRNFQYSSGSAVIYEGVPNSTGWIGPFESGWKNFPALIGSGDCYIELCIEIKNADALNLDVRINDLRCLTK